MSMGLFCSGKSASYACSDVLNCCAVQSCNNTELPSCLHQFPKPATKYPVNIENFTSPAGNDTHCDTKADWGACEIDFFFEFTGCCKSKGDEDTSEGYFQVPTADTESLSASLAMHPFSVLPLDPHGGPIETPGETNSGLSASNSASPTLPAAQNSVTLTLSVSQNSVASTPVLGSLPTRTLVGQTVSQTTKSSNTAAVAGGIAGGIVGLALLLAVLAICYRQRITRLLKGTDQGKLATWGSGQARATGAGGRELEEIKQGPSPTSSLLHPPSPWPLPPPPGYTPYRPHANEPERSPPNVSQPSASSPHTFDTHPPPESPPSPTPLNTRSSQDSANNKSEAQNVSPISSHYSSHPFDEGEDLKSSVFSEVSSNDLFHTQNKRS